MEGVPNDRLGGLTGQAPSPSFNVPITIYGDPDPEVVRGAVRDGILDATGLHFSIRHSGGLAFKGTPG